MDKGILTLLSLSGLFALTVILEGMGVLSTVHVKAMITITLLYHTGYAFFAVHEWRSRKRIRNKKRAGLRPPRSWY